MKMGCWVRIISESILGRTAGCMAFHVIVAWWDFTPVFDTWGVLELGEDVGAEERDEGESEDWDGDGELHDR